MESPSKDARDSFLTQGKVAYSSIEMARKLFYLLRREV